MNILTEKLPQGIHIGDKFYPVYTDFKNWIEIDILLSDKSYDYRKRVSEILALCYKELPETFSDAIEGVLWFYHCGLKRDDTKKEHRKERNVPIFSFKEDGAMVYSAFYAEYGIDLTKESLHWYQFRALFEGLSKEHKLFEVIRYRSVNLSDIKDKSRRAFYAEMKRMYKLKDNRSEEEKSGDVAESIVGAF